MVLERRVVVEGDCSALAGSKFVVVVLLITLPPHLVVGVHELLDFDVAVGCRRCLSGRGPPERNNPHILSTTSGYGREWSKVENREARGRSSHTWLERLLASLIVVICPPQQPLVGNTQRGNTEFLNALCSGPRPWECAGAVTCDVDRACSARWNWIARWTVGDKRRRCGTAGDNGEPIRDRPVPSLDREKLFERPLAQPPHLPYPAPKQMSDKKKHTHTHQTAPIRNCVL